MSEIENLKVFGDRVVLSLDPVDKKEKDKIILLEGSQASMSNYIKAKVLKVGDKCERVAPGDIVLRNLRAGAELPLGKEKYWMIAEDNLIGQFET